MEHYDILERLAVGGMGEVFLARQRGQGGFARTVVIKQLLPDAHEEGEQARRLLDEARLAASVAHENVVTVHEVGLHQGRPFLAMEYVHGVPLSALTRCAERSGVPMSPSVAARVVLDVARGLHAAHVAADAAGRPLAIVHRDVAPKNILVRADGISKIADFGVAAGADRLCRTATGAVPGTLSYMAPEQAGAGETSPRSDQFALGVVLWELLCGERLFKGDLPTDTLRRLLQLEVRAPSAVAPHAIPRALDDVVLRMLARDPARRFADLAHAARALDDAMPGLSGDATRAHVARAVHALAGPALARRLTRIESGAEVGPDDQRTLILARRGDGATPLTNEVAGLFDDTPTMIAPRGLSRTVLARAAGAAVVALAVGGAAGVAVRATWGELDHEALTRAWVAEESVEGPTVYAATLGEYAEERALPPDVADPVVAKLEELMALRLALVDAHWRKSESARAADANALEREMVRYDREAKAALATWPTDVARRALEDTKMFGRAPDDWVAADKLSDADVLRMAADAKHNGPQEMHAALLRAARRARVEGSAVDAAVPALHELFAARVRALEALYAGADTAADIDALDARAKNLVAERFPAHFFQTAFTLWRARSDIGRPGEPMPSYGPIPGDVEIREPGHLAPAEAP